MEGALVSVFLGIIYAVFTITVSVAGFLFTHFDVVNSMLIGGLSQFFVRNYEWSISSRWILFFVVFMVCEIIQHSFKIGRILFTVFSVYTAGMLSTVFMPRDAGLHLRE